MYKYPSNLKEKAKLMLWTMQDIFIILVGVLLSIFILTKTGLMLPLVLICTYTFLSIQIEDVSIKNYIIYAFKYCVSETQFYKWKI